MAKNIQAKTKNWLKNNPFADKWLAKYEKKTKRDEYNPCFWVIETALKALKISDGQTIVKQRLENNQIFKNSSVSNEYAIA